MTPKHNPLGANFLKLLSTIRPLAQLLIGILGSTKPFFATELLHQKKQSKIWTSGSNQPLSACPTKLLLFQFGDEVERSVREVNALLGELPEEGGKHRKANAFDSTEDVKVPIINIFFFKSYFDTDQALM